MSKTYQTILRLLPIGSIIAFFLIWFGMSARTGFLVPNPIQVVERFFVLANYPIANMSILGHTWASLRLVLMALFYAIVIGIPFGLLIGWSEHFRGIFKPIFEALRPIPPIAWVPLITMWLGIGDESRVFIIFLGCFMPIVVNTFTGVSMVPEQNIHAGYIFGANQRQVLFDIILPSAFPSIFAGIRTAIGVGWVVMLAAEMLSARSGLGFLVIRGSDSGDLALTMVSMVFIGSVGALISFIFNRLEVWLCPWKEK